MIAGATPGGDRIEAVLFDYGLTLVTFVRPGPALNRAYAEVSARLQSAGVRPVPSPAVLLRQVHDRIEQQVALHEDAGRLDELDILALERGAYARIGVPLSDQLLDEVTERVQRAWWDGITVAASTVPVLETLRAQGLRVGLCSNAPYRFMHAQLHHLGLARLLDSVTFSGAVGWRKPAPEIFAAALRELGVEASRCVMVGDRRREDVAGGRGAGMLTVRVREHRDDPGPGDADHVIDRLSDLPDLIASGHGSDKRGSVDGDGQTGEVPADQAGSVAMDVDFREFLRSRCRERGISLHRLALLCDLNQIYFYQAVNKNKDNPPPWVLRRAAPHLGVGYVDLLIAAGYLGEGDIREWESRHGAPMVSARA